MVVICVLADINIYLSCIVKYTNLMLRGIITVSMGVDRDNSKERQFYLRLEWSNVTKIR